MKYTANQRREHVCYNSVAIFIRLSVVASQICEIQRNSTKIRTYSSSRSSKIIDRDHRSWCQSKAHMQLPISHS